jgi:hypothetical protein
MKKQDLTDQRFGRLLVLKFHSRSKRGIALYLCRCDCGKEVILYHNHLRGGQQSCGCLAMENIIKASTTHGMSYTPEWNSYHSAKKRCNPKFAHVSNYKDWSGRGIEFRFKSFEEFYAEVGPRPEPKFDYSLERIDNNGHYERGNVRWATKIQQARNRRCDKCEILLARIAELERRLAELNMHRETYRIKRACR